MTNPLTENEILTAKRNWNHFSDVSYLSTAMECRELLPFFNDLRNHKVIEIGPGNNPVNKHFPCGEYSAAHGHHPQDELSVLRKEKDSSAVVVSFGVMDDNILSGEREVNKNYIEELVGEIRRVMNPFSIIFGSEAEKYLGKANVPAMPDCLESSPWPKYGGIYCRK
ncbi:MAG: hypothetical protein AABW88_00890 [Nanoarchaeota archaeon]